MPEETSIKLETLKEKVKNQSFSSEDFKNYFKKIKEEKYLVIVKKL